MAEMEALAEQEGVPIVHWETGRMLAALCRTLDPVVLEVGTAIGYRRQHMAEQLEWAVAAARVRSEPGSPGARPPSARRRGG